MTNKPMLSVELRALLERMLSEPESNASYGNLQDRAELRAMLSRSEVWVPCSPELLESGVDCATSPRWSSKEWDGHSHWHPAPIADHTQCEECKGWGYHENHHEGGGTECGECGGSGNAPVALVMPERLNTEGGYSLEAETWYNLALDDVASLNGVNK